MTVLSSTPARGRDERGAALPLAALAMSALVLFTSFAIDLGRQRLRARDVQAVADVAALDLARELRPDPTELDGVNLASPQAARWDLEQKLYTLVGPRNGFPASSLNTTVAVAHYSGGMATFYDPNDTTPRPVNAAFVSIRDTVEYFFQPGEGGVRKRAGAYSPGRSEPPHILPPVGCLPGEAECTPSCPIGTPCTPPPPCAAPCTQPTLPPSLSGIAAVEVGSFLAEIQQSLAAGTLPSSANSSCGGSASATAAGFTSLTTLNCSISVFYGVTNPAQSLRLTAVGYNGLASGTTSLGDLAASLTAGSVTQLLSTSVSRRNVILALADAATLDGQTASAALLQAFAANVSSTATMNLGQLIQVTQGTPEAAATARIGILDVLVGSAQVANGTNFLAPQFSLGNVAIGPLSVGVVMEAAIIELPQIKIGPAVYNTGTNSYVTTARTAQIASRLTLTFGVAGVGQIVLPVTARAASAIAELSGLRCATVPLAIKDDVLVSTRGISTYIGQFGDLRTSVPVNASASAVATAPLVSVSLSLGGILSLPTLVAVAGRSNAYVAGVDRVALLDLTPNDPSRNSGTVSAGVNTNVGTTLLANLQLSAAGVTLPVATTTSITSALGTVLNDLDRTLLGPVLDTLGVRIAGADARSPSGVCSAT